MGAPFSGTDPADLTGKLVGNEDAVPRSNRTWRCPIIIADVFDRPLRVRYRLVGTEIVKLRGREFTGRWLHEAQWNPVFLERVLAEYRVLIDERRPLVGVDDLYPANGPSLAYEWGMFPLADDGERVTHCLAIEDHRESERAQLLAGTPVRHSSARPKS